MPKFNEIDKRWFSYCFTLTKITISSLLIFLILLAIAFTFLNINIVVVRDTHDRAGKHNLVYKLKDLSDFQISISDVCNATLMSCNLGWESSLMVITILGNFPVVKRTGKLQSKYKLLNYNLQFLYPNIIRNASSRVHIIPLNRPQWPQVFVSKKKISKSLNNDNRDNATTKLKDCYGIDRLMLYPQECFSACQARAHQKPPNIEELQDFSTPLSFISIRGIDDVFYNFISSQALHRARQGNQALSKLCSCEKSLYLFGLMNKKRCSCPNISENSNLITTKNQLNNSLSQITVLKEPIKRYLNEFIQTVYTRPYKKLVNCTGLTLNLLQAKLSAYILNYSSSKYIPGQIEFNDALLDFMLCQNKDSQNLMVKQLADPLIVNLINMSDDLRDVRLLESAKKNLIQRLAFFGIEETLEETLKYFNFKIFKYPILEDLSIARFDTEPDFPKILPSVIAKLVENNILDIRLYEFALLEFRYRFKSLGLK